MLIASQRHRPEDLELWLELEGADLARGKMLGDKPSKALAAIREFNPNYASVSWGKDSVALAHLIYQSGLVIPLVWVKQIPLYNPDCKSVRDAFLSRWPMTYREIIMHLREGHYAWHATGSLEAGFAQAADEFGPRYVSGIRAQESGGRKIRMRKYGLASPNACAPLGWWTEADVFGYLAANDLPVHPVYAMLGCGRWERNQIRTCRLEGRGGDGSGRNEWEKEYYGDVLRRLKVQR